MKLVSRAFGHGHCGGFTLVELAVVLVIISVLLATLLGPLSTRMEQSDRQRTQATLDDAKEALYGFAVANGRLPCPDQDGDGLEDPDGGAGGCDVSDEGLLPSTTLGIEPNDAWGRPFRYRVTGIFADTDNTTACGIAPEPPPTVGVSFKLCSAGQIVIRDRAGAAPPAVTIGNQIPAIILSLGSNRNEAGAAIGGTLSAHEAENSDDDNIFVFKSYSRDDVQEFDDLVVWVSPNVLRDRMIISGRLP